MATLASLEAKLARLEARAEAIENAGQSYGKGDRTLERVSIDSVYDQIEKVEHRIACHPDNGGLRGSQVVFGGHRG